MFCDGPQSNNQQTQADLKKRLKSETIDGKIAEIRRMIVDVEGLSERLDLRTELENILPIVGEEDVRVLLNFFDKVAIKAGFKIDPVVLYSPEM